MNYDYYVIENGHLKTKSAAIPALGNNDVLIKTNYIGVNEFDLANLIANKNSDSFGTECYGVIERKGKDVKEFAIGQEVAYFAPLRDDAAATYIHTEQRYVSPLNKNIPMRVMVAYLYNGLAAHVYCKRTYISRPGIAIFIHNVDSYLGMCLARKCMESGALVFGGIHGSIDDLDHKDYHVHEIFDTTKKTWGEDVLKLTENLKLNAIYNCWGKQLFKESLELLLPLGIYIEYNNISTEVISEIDSKFMHNNSIFFTIPSMKSYLSNRFEISMALGDIYDSLRKLKIEPKMHKEFKFSQLDKALEELKKPNVLGKICLKC
jgi:NADPH:quinone reductase-like Zn-dependent oxidoreductase